MNEYLSFIEKLKTEKNSNLLEAIQNGLYVFLESNNKIIGYHGSDEKFDKFKFGKSKSIVMLSEIDVERNAIFFADNTEYASKFGKYVEAYELNLGKNPANVTDEYELATLLRPFVEQDSLGRWWYNDGYTTDTLFHIIPRDSDPMENTEWVKLFFKDGAFNWEVFDNPKFIENLKSNGYDSAFAWEDDGEKTIAILDLNNIKKVNEGAITESINENRILLESKKTYELKTKGGGKTTTTIPPSKRTFDNLPEYANGKSKVKFQDWLEMDPVTHSTGKGCDGKWYGWSHRAVYGFGIGDKVKKGDSGYKGKEYTIETEAQAKKAAEDFAESVS